MNSTVKMIIGFVAGVGVGVLGSYKYFDNKYATRADKEIADYNEYLKEKLDIIKDNYNVNVVDEDDSDDFKDETISQYHDEVRPYTADDIPKPRIVPTRGDVIDDDYHEDSPPEDPPEFDKNDIHIISTDEYMNGELEKITLYYYDDDDTLVDENEEIVEDERSVVGDIYKFNFEEGVDAPDVVYVRNPVLEADYEVLRLFRSYSETMMSQY